MQVLVRLLVAFGSLAVGVALVSLPGGCSSSTPAGPTTVRGRVTFQGQPVAGGLVVFAPDPDHGSSGKPVRGETGPDGTFQLVLDGGPSVPPGWYRVAIAPPPSAGAALRDGKPGFPLQLRRPDRSTVVREVVSGKEHFFELAVEVPTS
ncbi:MAG: hypothetical protein JWO38_3663 [Gemmataceae bacterium]|nr:hypothetical protein [Gemmataceae bacterium]